MVRPGSPGIRLLENLPQRPPTPPRESDHNKVHTEGPVLRRVLSDSLGVQTPPSNSPEPLNGSSNGTSDKSRKKVEWSAWTEYKEPPTKESPLQDFLRPLPPSSELKPAKSILKPYNGINPVDRRNGAGKLAAPHTYPNFAIMLESIVKQLAGEDRSSRIDAYLTLSGVLKASDDIPDSRALKEKMSLLTQFIQRDMSAKTASGTLDTVVINNALILLAFFVWNPPIADCLSNDFCSYVVEHAISALKDPLVSKDIVKHLLFILGRQNFSPKIMNPDRVRRLIEALVDIEEHVKGRSIILGRVGIYRKLLRQARTSMLSSIAWVENLFTDMTSNSREVRAPAVAFGSEAALLLGTEKQVSRAVVDLFRRDVSGTKYAHLYSKKLSLMVQNKQDGDLVPQIWSVVVLFLRYRPHQLEHWEFMMPWMHIIEKCFNSSDHDIKMEANLAWNRLVFAIQPDESTASTMVKLLGKVLDLQLKRKLVGRHAKEARQVTVGSVCNLLYYAFNPNATPKQLDLYWDEYVVQLISKTLVARDQVNSETEEEDLGHASDIISTLLDTSPKAWVINRANESGVVKAEELPSIDPKWVRKNAQQVFNVLGPLIQKFFMDVNKWEGSVKLIWSKFVASVGAAGAKEIKVSNDTMSSVASIFTLLYKLWETGPLANEPDSSSSFLKIFTVLVKNTTSSLGLLPFTERLLAMGPQEDFAVVATPSHHPHKLRGEMKCPLHHLFILLARPALIVKCDDSYFEMAYTILEPFFDDRKTRRSRIELAKDLCQLLPLSAPDSRASPILWQVLARFATLAFGLKPASGTSSSSSGSLDQPLGSEYRSFVKVLEHGILLSPDTILPEWRELFTAVITHVTTDSGQGGRAVSVIEPLSRALEDQIVQSQRKPSIAYCAMLISNALYPLDKQALEASRRRLWGTSNTSTKSSTFDPYSHLYIYISICLKLSYSSLIDDESVGKYELLSSVSSLVHGCPTILATGLLVGIQDGVAPWILDEAAKFGGRKLSIIRNCVATLWSNICALMSNLPHTDNNLLRSLDALICSGFESKHKRIVSATVSLWNSTFGNEPDLEYPPRVREAILRLRSVADIQLPSFPEHIGTESIGPTYEDGSQEDNPLYNPEDYNIRGSSADRERTPHLETSLPLLSHRASPLLAVELPSSGSRKRPFQGTPENNKRKVAKKLLTPKLRHDDSQVQFAAIHSSPLTDAVLDSQLLTDRQREVKERQREVGSIFANIGVSPSFHANSGLSHVASDYEPPTSEQPCFNEPSTPDLPLREKPTFVDYITSSPTPRRDGVTIQMESETTDPPSSPPQHRLVMAKPRTFILESSKEIVQRPDSDIWDVTSSPPVRSEDCSKTSTDLGPSAQVVEDFIITETEQEISSIDNSMDFAPPKSPTERPRTPLETYGSLTFERQASRTPNEVFVDALSSPAPPSPIKDLGSDRPSIHGIRNGQDTSAPKLMAQNDSQMAFSLSDADEDSMLRLITKFDKPGLQQHHTNTDNDDGEDIMEPDSSVKAMNDDLAANKKNNEMTKSPLTASKQSSHQTVHQGLGLSDPKPKESAAIKLTSVKPLRTNFKLKKMTQATFPIFDKTAIREAHLKHGSKQAGRPITRRRKINDEQVEVPDSLTVDAIESPKLQRSRIGSRTGPSELKDNVAGLIITDQHGQSTPGNLDNQVSDLQNIIGEGEQHISLENSNSENEEVSAVLNSGQNIRSPTRITGKHENRENKVDDDDISGIPSAGDVRAGESSSKVITRIEGILASLRAVALTREEAQKVENLLWDVKGELYAAEKRGRAGG